MEVTFKDILRIIKKNIAFVIIMAVLFSLVSFFCTSLFIPKTYKTTVKLYIETSFTDSSSANESLQSYSYAEKLVSTSIQMLSTNNFYTVLSDEMNGKYTPLQISSMVAFRGIENTEIFLADVSAPEPVDAKKLADIIAAEAPEVISNFNEKVKLKVVDDATLPNAPVSPNVLKNVLVAFILGTVLALVTSFVRDYLDVKIKYDDDMTTLCNIPILAAVPDFESFVNPSKKY